MVLNWMKSWLKNVWLYFWCNYFKLIMKGTFLFMYIKVELKDLSIITWAEMPCLRPTVCTLSKVLWDPQGSLAQGASHRGQCSHRWTSQTWWPPGASVSGRGSVLDLRYSACLCVVYWVTLYLYTGKDTDHTVLLVHLCINTSSYLSLNKELKVAWWKAFFCSRTIHLYV